jgi:imidazolonepropionase-like amidohydrolase
MRNWNDAALVFLLIVFRPSPWLASRAFADSKPKAIKFGKLVDGTGNVQSNALVVVQDGKVVSVSRGDSAIPPDAEVIDMTRYTGIPGLIDVHTHMTYYWDGAAGSRPWEQLHARLPAVTVFLAQENARKTLEAGVTTVRDLGAAHYNDIAMRDLINRGAMLGPRMFVSGYGLHVTAEPARPGFVSPQGGQADGVPNVLRVVRQQIAAGADVVKMYGSTGSGEDVTGDRTYESRGRRRAPAR